MPTEHQGQLREINKEYHYDFMCRDEKRLNGEMSAARRIGYENGHKEGLGSIT